MRNWPMPLAAVLALLIWPAGPAYAATKTTLQTGQTMVVGYIISSSNWEYYAELQADGNLVIHRGATPAEDKGVLWESAKAGGYTPQPALIIWRCRLTGGWRSIAAPGPATPRAHCGSRTAVAVAAGVISPFSRTAACSRSSVARARPIIAARSGDRTARVSETGDGFRANARHLPAARRAWRRAGGRRPGRRACRPLLDDLPQRAPDRREIYQREHRRDLSGEPTAAYLRVHTEWANGHSCTLWGVATAEPGGLVYRAPPGDGAEGCVLSIRHVGGHLRMNDEVGEHCRSDCGARGTFDNVDLPFSSRRRIRYGARLEASWQFKETIAAWRKRAVPGQAIR